MKEGDFNIINQHIQNLHARLRKDDGDLLFHYPEKKNAFKNKKLTVFFVERLLYKFRLPTGIVQKCAKAPHPVVAQVMDLVHKIVVGKLPYSKLADLKGLLCEELSVIPVKLKDAVIFNDVKGYIERHVRK